MDRVTTITLGNDCPGPIPEAAALAILKVAAQERIDPTLLSVTMRHESGFGVDDKPRERWEKDKKTGKNNLVGYDVGPMQVGNNVYGKSPFTDGLNDPFGTQAMDPNTHKYVDFNGDEMENLILVARQLGHPSRDPLRSQFPELCKAISARYAQSRANQRNVLRIGLEAALTEDPPPSLRQLAILLGNERETIKVHFPKLARAILRRHRAYHRKQFENLGPKLRAVLHETPSSSLITVARRLEHTQEYLKKYFPALSAAISKRHAELSKKQTLENTEFAKKHFRRFALDSYSRGMYPSLKRIREEMNQPTGLERSEAQQILSELRLELGISRSYFRKDQPAQKAA